VRNAAMMLLLAWAVVATILAIRPAESPSPPPPAGSQSDAGKIERLQLRIAELTRRAESKGPEARSAATDGGRGPAPAPPKTFGEAADWMVAEYRRLRDAGMGDERRAEILERLARLAERNRSLYLVWPFLLREARDEEEAEDIACAPGDAVHPDPEGPIDVAYRTALRAILALDPRPFRRAYAAEMLMERVRSRPEDFRAALSAARRERDAEARVVVLHAMSDTTGRSLLNVADAAAYVRLVRRELSSGDTSFATPLAAWSEDRADFDDLRERLARAPDASLVRAFRGSRALTKGREAECRAAIAAVAGNASSPRSLRTTAVTVLDSLRPWDAATEDAVRRFRESFR